MNTIFLLLAIFLMITMSNVLSDLIIFKITGGNDGNCKG